MKNYFDGFIKNMAIQLTKQVLPRKCKIQECQTVGQYIFDPCSEKHYYVCTNRKTQMLCPNGTHFAKEKGKKFLCSHIYNTISEKEKFSKTCKFSKNFSIDACRKIWPEDGSKRNMTTLPESSQETNSSHLFTAILISFYMICLLGLIIFLLIKRKNLKIRNNNDNMNKNNQQPEKENEDSVYEGIDETQMTDTIPAQMIASPEIYHKLESFQNLPYKKDLHESRFFNKDSLTDMDTQEVQYNVSYVAGTQEDFKSNEKPPEGCV